MNTFCCQSCFPYEPDTAFVPFHHRRYNNSPAKSNSTLKFTSHESPFKIRSNRNRNNKNSSKSSVKIQVSKETAAEQKEKQTSKTEQTKIVYIFPTHVKNKMLQRIQKLEKQNNQYMSIILNELIPLRKDYQNLKKDYQKNLQLVYFMDLKLKDLQKIYNTQPKSIMNSNSTVASYQKIAL